MKDVNTGIRIIGSMDISNNSCGAGRMPTLELNFWRGLMNNSYTQIANAAI
jgi:hypothetical protein